MADEFLVALPPAAVLTGPELIYLEQGGSSRQGTADQMIARCLRSANNLADVPSPVAARTNLSVYSIAQVDALVTGLLDFKGDQDCSANPNYPVGLKGDSYYVSVAGKIGGAAGKAVDIGDVFVCKADNAGGTEAAVGASWFVLEHNLSGALLASDEATALQIIAGTAGKVVVADKLHDAHLPQILTDAAPTTLDFSLGFNAEWTLTDAVGAARTLSAPTNYKKGLTYVLALIQGGTGSKTITWPASFNWGAAGTPVLSTAAGKCDIITLYCRDAVTPVFRAVFSKDA